MRDLTPPLELHVVFCKTHGCIDFLNMDSDDVPRDAYWCAACQKLSGEHRLYRLAQEKE